MEKLLNGKLIRSSGNFLSVTDLINCFKIVNNENYLNISDITNSNKFIKSIHDIIFNNEKYNSPILINESYSYANFKIECDAYGTAKVLKKLGVWKTTGARHTKQVMCDERIWKFLYINIFNEHCSINMPEWIKQIDIDFYRFSIKRNESLEIDFINILLPKIELFLDSKPILQYKLGNYIYDIYIEIFNKKILIEYNEIAHNQKLEQDFEKAKYAIENNFYIIYIPQGRENDIKEYLKDIKSDYLSFKDCLELCKIRFNQFIEHQYDKDIDKKVFPNNNLKSRVTASYKELKNIIDINFFIKNAIHMRFIKNSKDIYNAIENYSF